MKLGSLRARSGMEVKKVQPYVLARFCMQFLPRGRRRLLKFGPNAPCQKTSMSRSRSLGRQNLPCEEHQGGACQANATKQPEAIEGCQERRLLIQNPVELGMRVNRCLRRRDTMFCKIFGQLCQHLLVTWAERSSMTNKNRSMILSAASQHRGHKRDAEACSLIAEQVRQTRSLIVLVLRQKGVRELAHRNEERGNAEALDRTCKSLVLVVGTQVEAGVI